MLFEIVYFQVEILNSSLMDAIHMKNTGDLDRLKLAAYSVSFGHERLVQAFGNDEIKYLPAIEELVNMITGWQIGGDRPLSQQERELLVEYSAKYAEIVPIYGILVNSDHKVISAEADQLNQLGQELDDLITK
ncbi:hypothetical protein D3C76_1329040 [compost metagenome]